MAFQAYNIQLLPLDTKTTEEVGVIGYKTLLENLSQSFKKAVKEKRLIAQSFNLVNDTYFCPFVIHARDDVATGSLVKFHKADNVQDLYTKEDLYVKSENATPVSSIYFFRFVFDFELHTLLIEELGGRLPSPLRMEKALAHFFEPIASDFFPEHTLTVNLISEKQTLTRVLKQAKGFSVISVKLTFPNSPALLPNALKELKEKNIHKVEHNLSASPGGMIPEPTEYMSELLEHVNKYGEAAITYYKEIKKGAKLALQRVKYVTKDYPRKIFVRQGVAEEDESFVRRALSKFKGAK